MEDHTRVIKGSGGQYFLNVNEDLRFEKAVIDIGCHKNLKIKTCPFSKPIWYKGWKIIKSLSSTKLKRHN